MARSFSFALICLLAVSCGSAAAATELTLEQSIEIALRDNRDLAALRLSLDAARYGVDLAEAPFALRFEPDLNASADQDSSTATIGGALAKQLSSGGDVEAGVRAVESSRDGLADERRGSVVVQVDQPLFRNFGALVNREAVVQATHNVKSARRRIELAKVDLVLRVVEAHEDVIRLQKRLAADEQNYRRFDQLYRLTRVREHQGRTTRIDTLRAEFERGRAELSITSTTEELASRRRDLADLLAMPLDAGIVALPGVELDIPTPPPAVAVGIALSNRLDYAEVLQDFHDAARGVAIAERELLPDLNVLARYEQFGEGEDSSDAWQLDQEAWFVGVSGDTDVPQRSGRAQLGQARITEKSAIQQIQILESALGLQVRQALTAYERATVEVGQAERNLALALNRARLSRKMFQMGRADNFTVTDAENGLVDAENDLLAARAGKSISSYRLLRTLGTLIESPADLKPGSSTSNGHE
jgi:outer membrane protein TolC